MRRGLVILVSPVGDYPCCCVRTVGGQADTGTKSTLQSLDGATDLRGFLPLATRHVCLADSGRAVDVFWDS